LAASKTVSRACRTKGAGKQDVEAALQTPLFGKFSIRLGRRLPGLVVPVIDRANLLGRNAPAHEEVAKSGRKHDDPVHVQVHETGQTVDSRGESTKRDHAGGDQGIGPKILDI